MDTLVRADLATEPYIGGSRPHAGGWLASRCRFARLDRHLPIVKLDQ